MEPLPFPVPRYTARRRRPAWTRPWSTVERRLSTCYILVPEDNSRPCWMCVLACIQVVLVNNGPSLSAERYEELRGAVQKALNPNKLMLCFTYCLGKQVMSFFFLFSLLPLFLSRQLSYTSCSGSFRLSPPFAKSCELQRQTCIQGLACFAVDYLRRRTVCVVLPWPLAVAAAAAKQPLVCASSRCC